MEIKRTDLITALEKVKPGLAKRETIEQTTSFAFIEGRVVTYNDELSVSHPIPGLELTGAVEAQPLYDLLKKLDKDKVTLRVNEGKLKVSGGRSRATLTLHEEVRLPLEEVGEPEDWLEFGDANGFLDALRFAHRSCSRNTSRPILTCVHVSLDGHVEASDSYRLSRVDTDDAPAESVLIPATSVRVLLGYDITHMAVAGGWAHFATSEDTLVRCRVYQGEFPDIDKHLDVEGHELDLSALDQGAIERSMIFAERDYELDEEIKVSIGDKKMKISASATFGSYDESLPFGEDEPKASFAINPALLKDILGQSTQAVIGDGRLKFTGEGWQHVIALRMEG